MHELGTFAVVYPCWAIVHKDSTARDANNKPIGYTSPMKFMNFFIRITCADSGTPSVISFSHSSRM